VSTKQCRACEAVLPLNDFYVYNERPQSYCKECCKAKARKWAKENRERVNERRRLLAAREEKSTYVPKAPEERAAYYAKYAERNKQLLKAALKKMRCGSCGAKEKLVAKLEDVPLTAKLERSVRSFRKLLEDAVVHCKLCQRKSQLEEWEKGFDPEELRECQYCGEVKPTREFTLTIRLDQIRTCKECSKVRRQRKVRKCRRLLDKLKANPCTDCGWEFPPEAMDFDHLPEYEKQYSISDLASQGRLKALKAELQKCELVCACCHRVRTAQRRKPEST